MAYLFTSESVSEGHPDKIADQISDAILDAFLAEDDQAKVACETLVTTGLVVLAGEVNTHAYIDLQKVAREMIEEIGYTKSEYKFDSESCGIISTIHGQSQEINKAVVKAKPEEMGAGDQGMMFGYATDETENYMPLALDLCHMLLHELSKIRKAGQEMTYLRPDAKSQVTIEYDDDHRPVRIDTIVISTQHDDVVHTHGSTAKLQQSQIEADVKAILIPRVLARVPASIQALFDNHITYHINPSGAFVIGGPHGDTGLTGRKIIVDTYGGKGAHGGGAFSGKDPSKVDRSAAYATRHIAKNLVAAGVASQVLVQVAYAIGVAEPVGLYVNTYGTANVKDENGNTLHDGAIAERLQHMDAFDMRPAAIIKRFGLQNPIYRKTAAYGHMGRTPGTVVVKNKAGEATTHDTFTWERLDAVEQVKAAFGLGVAMNA